MRFGDHLIYREPRLVFAADHTVTDPNDYVHFKTPSSGAWPAVDVFSTSFAEPRRGERDDEYTNGGGSSTANRVRLSSRRPSIGGGGRKRGSRSGKRIRGGTDAPRNFKRSIPLYVYTVFF